MNRIYLFWFNDGDYESGDTCYTVIAKTKKRAIKMVKEEYSQYAYDHDLPLIMIIGYSPLKEKIC